MMSTEPGGFVESSDDTLVHFIDLDLHAEALRAENDPIIHGENDARTSDARKGQPAPGQCAGDPKRPCPAAVSALTALAVARVRTCDGRPGGCALVTWTATRCGARCARPLSSR